MGSLKGEAELHALSFWRHCTINRPGNAPFSGFLFSDFFFGIFIKLNTQRTNEWGEWDSLPVAGHVNHAIRAGLPLESGLRALAAQTRSRGTRRALVELSDNLERGTPLVDAMRESESRLPRTMTALVEAGMETGRLDSVMQYSLEQSQRALWLRQEIWMSLAYPLFLFWFALSICGLILLWIIPNFEKIFEDFGTELPDLTRGLIQLSRIAQQIGWIPIIAILPLMIIGLILILGFGQSSFSRRWSTSIPLLGSVFRMATLSEFCQVLALLMESKLPFSKALRYAANASDDDWISRKCRAIALEIEKGTTAEEAAFLAGFPNSLRQVFRHIGSHRTVIDALRSLSELYAARSSVASRLMNSILEPFTVLMVLGFAGLSAIALFLPLIKLLNDLS